MSNIKDKISEFLFSFNLDDEEVKLYLFLLQKNYLSALDISRALHLSRTKVYRLLDRLREKGLVHQKLEDLGLKFEANSPLHFNTILEEKQHEVDMLKSLAPNIIDQLVNLTSPNQTVSKVLYYTGTDGLYQITMNSLKAKEKLFIYEMQQDMTAFIDEDHAEYIRKEIVKNSITTYQLTNATQILPFTNVTEMIKNYWKIRHINPQELAIDFEVLIYNDVYCLYTYKNNEFFSVEIYNEFLARMQKQLFEFIWEKAIPMNINNLQGSASLPSLKSDIHPV